MMNYKKKANLTAAGLLLGFILLAVMKYKLQGQHLFLLDVIFAIVEAALIGSMADWFAVTAIFRKPLGFPFHTAIIPNNRKTIENSVVKIVEQQFLSPEILSQRLQKLSLSKLLHRWIDSEAGKRKIIESIHSLLQSLQAEGEVQKLSSFLSKVGCKGINALDLGTYSKEFIDGFTSREQYKGIYFLLLDKLTVYVEGPVVRNQIAAQIEKMKAEKTKGLMGAFLGGALENTNVLNVEELADTIHLQLVQTLYRLQQEDSLEGRHMLGTLHDYAMANVYLPFSAEELQEIASTVFQEVTSTGNLKNLLKRLADAANRLTEQSLPEEQQLMLQKQVEDGLFELVYEMLEGFLHHKRVAAEAEELLKKGIQDIIRREYNIFGSIARQTMEAFDDEALNAFIENRAGNDLQWIRINGAIVGGMVGLLVFLFLRLFYDPIGVPFITHLFQ